MTKVLGREELLSGACLKKELVEFPDLGVSVYVREFSSTQALQFNQRIKQLKENGVKDTTPEMDLEIMILAVSLSVCDENGNLLFASEEDAKDLAKNSLGIISTLGAKALRLSGLGVDSASQLTSEVADDLPNAPTSSPSGLPTNSKKRRRK